MRDFAGLPRDETYRLQREETLSRGFGHAAGDIGAILACGPSEVLAKSEFGPCRACHDLTVLPDFGDGRCFGCVSDEVDESEQEAIRKIRPRVEFACQRLVDIIIIFAEAQEYYKKPWHRKSTQARVRG